jgi:pilus assembly protein CpaF
MSFLRRGSSPQEPAGQAAGAAPAASAQSDDYQPDTIQVARIRDAKDFDLVQRSHAKLVGLLGRELESAGPDAIKALIADRLGAVLDEEKTPISRVDRQRIQAALEDEIVGYGPIQTLIDDDGISEIMINGPRQVWIERGGKLFLTDVTFSGDEHLMRLVQRIVAPLGRRIDESSPYVDARLPDGSRVNAVIPPLSLVGPILTIRKFRKNPLSPADLVANGTLTEDALEFLRATVKGRTNIIVVGGTGSGKTTLLNTLSSFISPRERIITIEDAAELRLQQVHVLTLESRPPNIEGQGAVAIRDLLRNSLRMRPDRIVVGECRGGEALDMLQAMNTGHEGSMTTVHANSPRDAISRIETMVLMAGAELPLRAIREQIASAVDLVVYIERIQDGSRRITQVSEVGNLQGDVVTMSDIFVFESEGMQDGKVVGALRPTGVRPAFGTKLAERGIELPAHWFGYAGR